MRNSLRIVPLVLLICTLTVAQDAPRAEVFGGYSFARQSILPTLQPIGLDHVNSNGWMAGGSGYLNKWLGIKAEVNGVYSHRKISFVSIPELPSNLTINESVYTYTFGPTIAYRDSSHVQPFAHALFGVAHMRMETSVPFFGPAVSDSTNAFAMQFGGGVDVPLKRAFAIRGQADWVQSRFDTGFNNDTQNHFKVSAGVVFRFGGK